MISFQQIVIKSHDALSAFLSSETLRRYFSLQPKPVPQERIIDQLANPLRKRLCTTGLLIDQPVDPVLYKLRKCTRVRDYWRDTTSLKLNDRTSKPFIDRACQANVKRGNNGPYILRFAMKANNSVKSFRTNESFKLFSKLNQATAVNVERDSSGEHLLNQCDSNHCIPRAFGLYVAAEKKKTYYLTALAMSDIAALGNLNPIIYGANPLTRKPKFGPVSRDVLGDSHECVSTTS